MQHFIHKLLKVLYISLMTCFSLFMDHFQVLLQKQWLHISLQFAHKKKSSILLGCTVYFRVLIKLCNYVSSSFLSYIWDTTIYKRHRSMKLLIQYEMQYKNQLCQVPQIKVLCRISWSIATTSTELASVHLSNFFTLLLYHVMRQSSDNSIGSKVKGFTSGQHFQIALCALLAWYY